ncbi:MAG: hydrogenase maturation protease [Gammaproteobacteria bacterium]
MTLHVIGIGSDAGDDQVGWLVANRLRKRRRDVQAFSCRAPMELLGRLPLSAPLLIVDAVRSNGQPPGTVHQLQWPAAKGLGAWGQPFTSHGLGLADALCLADRLELLPHPTLVWGIEIPKPVATADLSASVLAGVEVLLQAVDRDFPL